MGRVLTNNVQLAYTVESTLGVLPGSPTWKGLEPNAVKKYGAAITHTAREPISNIRQRRKGTVTDLDSTVEVDMDLTMEHFIDFVEGFCFSAFKGTAPFVPTAVTNASPSTYTVPSGGALAAGTLLYARGFANAANNGFHVVGASSSGTTIKVAESLVTESSPPTNVQLEVCGVRGTAGDLKIDSSGNLTSTTLDFTTLGLFVGQAIWIGGDLAANSFFGTTNRGYARINAIAATKLTLSKRGGTYTTDDGTSTGSGGTARLIDIFFGRFVRNVAANSGDYLEKSFQFELTYPNLQPVSGDMYEYAKGNFCNSMTFELPLTSKAVTTCNFVGTDTPSPTTTRATNASSALSVLKATAFNTSADVARLRITNTDESGLSTDFKSLKLTINNQASGEKVVSQLGSKYINVGIMDVDIEADLLFTNSAVADAVRTNLTVTMDWSVRNQDGAILIDIPAMTFNTGDRDFPVNQTVQIKTTASAFKDDTLGTSLGITVFAYAPAA